MRIDERERRTSDGRKARIDLDAVRIDSPCPKRWDELRGDARTRFCETCSLHVHNLSALSRGEARDLLEEKARGGGRICVAFARGADGALRTTEPALAAPRPARGARLVALARSAAALVVGALGLVALVPGCGRGAPAAGSGAATPPALPPSAGASPASTASTASTGGSTATTDPGAFDPAPLVGPGVDERMVLGGMELALGEIALPVPLPEPAPEPAPARAPE